MPVGLSVITKLSPKEFSSMTVGLWMLASAVAGYLTGEISKLGRIKFELVNIADFKMAASVYLQSFTIAAVTLLTAALLLFLFRKKLLRFF